MPIFNAVNYQELVSLAASEPGGQINLTGLEQTFLINLLTEIPWTESKACHAIWTDKASLTASQKDAAGALIDGTIHKMMEAIDNCQPQIDALNGQITTLQADKAALQSQINTLNGQITTLQADKAALQNQVATLNGQITTLQADKAALQSQVTSLQAQLANINVKKTINSDQFIGGTGSLSFWIYPTSNNLLVEFHWGVNSQMGYFLYGNKLVYAQFDYTTLQVRTEALNVWVFWQFILGGGASWRAYRNGSLVHQSPNYSGLSAICKISHGLEADIRNLTFSSSTAVLTIPPTRE